MSKRKWTSEEVKKLRLTNKKNFYYNMEDTNLFVRREWGGIGWSLNFANPLSWLVGAGLIIFFAFLLWFLISYCS